MTGANFPALFVSHGAPSIALEENGYKRALAGFGQRFASPRAIVVVSAHFEEAQPITASERPELIYDFTGFPAALYRLDYAAPGAPDLAARILELLRAEGLGAVLDPERGWDHGVWIPLRLAYPDAAVAVVELSLPNPHTPEVVHQMGRALAPLRQQGILLVGSGGVVHNLARIRFGERDASVDQWASEFDQWAAERVEKLDLEELRDYRRRAPRPALSVPTSEHFDPLFFVLGAWLEGDRVWTIHEGFLYGNLSMRVLALSGAVDDSSS